MCHLLCFPIFMSLQLSGWAKCLTWFLQKAFVLLEQLTMFNVLSVSGLAVKKQNALGHHSFWFECLICARLEEIFSVVTQNWWEKLLNRVCDKKWTYISSCSPCGAAAAVRGVCFHPECTLVCLAGWAGYRSRCGGLRHESTQRGSPHQPPGAVHQQDLPWSVWQQWVHTQDVKLSLLWLRGDIQRGFVVNNSH